MEKNRVKFYSTSDFVYGYMVNKAIDVLKVLDENVDSYSLDDILELYNINKYLENTLFPKDFPAADQKYFDEAHKKKINKIISIYVSKLNDDNIERITQDLHGQYNEDFWSVIVKYKVYNRISNKTFKKILPRFNLLGILAYKSLVSKYDYELTEELMENPNYIDILISKYLRKSNGRNIFLPDSFTLEKKEEFVKNYIESEVAHINVLDLLAHMPILSDFQLSDDTRTKAIEKHDELCAAFFEEKRGVHFETSMQVSYSSTQKEAVITDYKDSKLSCSVSEKWIENNLDYPTLLNNFIYIFSLVDMEMRVSNVSKPNQCGIFERIFSFNDYIKYYSSSHAFSLLNNFTVIKMASYCEYLKSKYNIRIEDVLQWFFDEYLKNEFNVDSFIVNLPSESSTYLEKCRTLCSEMECLFKQFDSYIKYGTVKHNIIENSSKPIEIKNIKSFHQKKYLYAKDGECVGLMNLLFSDQTVLSYLSKRENRKEYDNLFSLLKDDVVNISEYEEYQKKSIMHLVDKKIIQINEHGFLSFVNFGEVAVLCDLYYNGFASVSYYRKHNMMNLIETLQQKDWIFFSGELLASPESDYFNYYLNKSDFSNGFDLRNKYLHGTQRKKGSDDELHKMNYYTLLMLYVIIVIKINEEFCERSGDFD